MDKSIEMTMLYDIYGKLLTTKQKDIFEQYYIYNLSLREIAENKKISYQAVRDSIKTSENMLENFESNIGMKNLVRKIEIITDIIENSDEINSKKDEILKIIKK